MTAYTFVGPDGKAYSENKPEEGGFLSYFDGCKWFITFPLRNSLAHSFHYFFGDQLPSSANQWKISLEGSVTQPPVRDQNSQDAVSNQECLDHLVGRTTC